MNPNFGMKFLYKELKYFLVCFNKHNCVSFVIPYNFMFIGTIVLLNVQKN